MVSDLVSSIAIVAESTEPVEHENNRLKVEGWKALNLEPSTIQTFNGPWIIHPGYRPALLPGRVPGR